MIYEETKQLCRKPCKTSMIIFAFIDLKIEIKEDIAFILKAKTHTVNAPLEQRLFDSPKCYIQLKIRKIWKN